MSVRPVQIQRENDEYIVIDWSDGQKRKYSVKSLRQNCPCASCATEVHKEQEKPANPMELRVIPLSQTKPIRLLGMKPVGHYAYDLQFSDGHNSGIYTFEILLKLGEPIEQN